MTAETEIDRYNKDLLDAAEQHKSSGEDSFSALLGQPKPTHIIWLKDSAVFWHPTQPPNFFHRIMIRLILGWKIEKINER